MGDEEKENTGITLKEFLLEKINTTAYRHEQARVALEKNVEANRVMLEKNVEQARIALEKNFEEFKRTLEKRLETMNEFRESLRDQTGQYVTRKEVELTVDKLSSDIRSLRESRAGTEGAASRLSVYLTMGTAAAALVVAIVDLFVKH